jgi:hypothetical protein
MPKDMQGHTHSLAYTHIVTIVIVPYYLNVILPSAYKFLGTFLLKIVFEGKFYLRLVSHM